MYESVKKRVRRKCFHKKPWRWQTPCRIQRAASSFDCLKVKLETGAGSGPWRTFSVGCDLGFSSVCQLFSRGPGPVGEGTVNGSCYFYLGDFGAVLSRRMI